MKLFRNDIFKILRLFGMMAFVLLLLTSCSPNTPNSEPPNKEAQLAVGTDKTGEELSAEQANCWQSEVLNTIYKVLGKVTGDAHKHLTQGAMALMMMSFACWFAYKMIIHVSSVSEINMGEFWTEVTRKLFICFACGLLASSTVMLNFCMNTIIFPVFNGIIEYGSMILAASAKNTSSSYVSIFDDSLVTFKMDLACKASDILEKSDSFFPDKPKQMMGCMVCSVNERLNVTMSFIFRSLKEFGIIKLIVSVVLWCCIMFVKLGFVFYLVDTLFRFTIMAIMLPLLIMSFAFKQTSSWAKKGFLYMIHSGALISLIGIMIVVALTAMETMFSTQSSSSSAEEVSTVLKEGLSNIGEFGVTFLCLMLICFLLIQATKIAVGVTNSLVGVSVNTKFNQNLTKVLSLIVGFLTARASKVVEKVMRKPKKAVGDATKKLGNTIGSGLYSAFK